MKILFVVSECVPLIKTGGLADVAGALPLALREEGCRVRVLLPAYPGLADRLDAGEVLLERQEFFGGPAQILAGRAGGLDLLLLDAPHLYDRPGRSPYNDPEGRDWTDNPVRFAALGLAAAEIGRGGLGDGWVPELVHAHDWQAGLAPVYLEQDRGRPAVVTTIHNIAYQGNFSADWIGKLGLPPGGFKREGYEFWGRVSFLKAGLVHADAITTVSPTYARELMTETFGFGLEGVIAARRGNLCGILNGIDLDAWNPATDPAVTKFDARRLARRAANRRALRDVFGLPAEMTGPLFSVVSRLTEQKGLDLLLGALPALIGTGAQLVVLGSGETALENAFMRAAAMHPDRVGVRIGYDEPLSHLFYAGSDALLVPSRFEPCGLTQLYALRYGALPVVARTGGLADTVIDANAAALDAGVATGIQFDARSTDALAAAIVRAGRLYADPKLWRRIQRNGLKHPVGWQRSAAAYRALYTRTLQSRG